MNTGRGSVSGGYKGPEGLRFPGNGPGAGRKNSVTIYIFADLEGISGIFSREQVLTSGSRFQEGRDFMTADINAAAEGCKQAGADRVIVRDGHGGGYSVRWEKLSPAVDEVICGTYSGERFAEFSDVSGLILLGYHGMAGTYGAILEHSMNSTRVQNYWINGEKAGETAIDARIAGEHDVPVIMVSGDDKVCAEARALLPWIETAQVKKGLSSFGGALLGPEKAHELIRATARRSVERLAEMKVLKTPAPVHFRVELMERIPLPNPRSCPGLKILDGRTFEVEAETVEDALFRV